MRSSVSGAMAPILSPDMVAMGALSNSTFSSYARPASSTMVPTNSDFPIPKNDPPTARPSSSSSTTPSMNNVLWPRALVPNDHSPLTSGVNMAVVRNATVANGTPSAGSSDHMKLNPRTSRTTVGGRPLLICAAVANNDCCTPDNNRLSGLGTVLWVMDPRACTTSTPIAEKRSVRAAIGCTACTGFTSAEPPPMI